MNMRIPPAGLFVPQNGRDGTKQTSHNYNQCSVGSVTAPGVAELGSGNRDTCGQAALLAVWRTTFLLPPELGLLNQSNRACLSVCQSVFHRPALLLLMQ